MAIGADIGDALGSVGAAGNAAGAGLGVGTEGRGASGGGGGGGGMQQGNAYWNFNPNLKAFVLTPKGRQNQDVAYNTQNTPLGMRSGKFEGYRNFEQGKAAADKAKPAATNNSAPAPRGPESADPNNGVYFSEDDNYYVNADGLRVNPQGDLFNTGDGQWVNGVNAARDERMWNDDLSSTIGSTTDEILANMQRQGIDGSQYVDDYINPYLNDIGETISPGSADIGSYFNDNDITSAIMGNIRGDVNKANAGMFDPYTDQNYLSGAYSESALDPVISSILDPQKADASAYLDRALARGMINDQGYDRGLSEIDNMYATGAEDVRGVGQGILGGYSDSTDTYIENALSNATNWDFGGDYDFGGFETGLNDRVSSNLSGLGGDVRGSVGDRQFFDLGGLIQKGTGASGIFNPNGSSLSDALAKRGESENAERGLGTQGAF